MKAKCYTKTAVRITASNATVLMGTICRVIKLADCDDLYRIVEVKVNGRFRSSFPMTIFIRGEQFQML